MSDKPRTPRHFPKMHVRGKRRREQAQGHLLARSFDQFGKAIEFSADAFRKFAEAFA